MVNRSIWNFFSSNNLREILHNDIGFIESEASIGLGDQYYTSLNLSNTGFYFNLWKKNPPPPTRVAHLTMHNSASAFGSLSHVVDESMPGHQVRRDVVFDYVGGQMEIYLLNPGYTTVYMELILNSARTGLNQLAEYGAIRDNIVSGGGIDKIVFNVTDIPVDNYFLINLILSKYVLQLKIMKDYALFQINKKNIKNYTISFKNIISNKQYIGIFNKIKKLLEPLTQYCQLFEQQLKNELIVSKQTLENFVLTSISNLNGIPNYFTDSEIEKIDNKIKTILNDTSNSSTAYDTKISLQESDKVVQANETDNYKTKYIKYKNKYLSLKNFK